MYRCFLTSCAMHLYDLESSLVSSGCYNHLAKDYDGGKFCKDAESWKNICDGTWSDCLMKGKDLCNKDQSCYGIQMHDGGFVNFIPNFKKNQYLYIIDGQHHRKGSKSATVLS